MPKYRSYNSEIRNSVAQLLDFFNDIVIDRRTGDDAISQTISVPCVYGNRGRLLKSLENGDKTLSVPLIVLSLMGVSRDTERVNDLNTEILDQPASGPFDQSRTKPVPININFELSLVAKYQQDVDQLISNFSVFSNPDFFLVLKHPKEPEWKLKAQVVWDGSITMDYPREIQSNEPYRCTATTTFVMKTWLFPGMDADYRVGPLIHKINFCPRLFEVGDDGYMLDRWYDVPHSMSFDAFTQNVICGLIKPDPERIGTSADFYSRDNYDFLRISGGYDTSGAFVGVSGYWQDVSGVFDYAPSGSHVSYVTGDLCYLQTQEGYTLLYAATAPWIKMTPGLAAVDYLNICVSADVSGSTSGGCLP